MLPHWSALLSPRSATRCYCLLWGQNKWWWWWQIDNVDNINTTTGACTTLHRHTSPSHCNWPVMWMLDDVFVLLYQWRWSYLRRVVQRWVIEHSRCQLRGHGTPCHLTLELHRHSPRSGRSSNKHFFCSHSLMSDWRQCVVQCPCNSL